jgi:hypothetical protein
LVVIDLKEADVGDDALDEAAFDDASVVEVDDYLLGNP